MEKGLIAQLMIPGMLIVIAWGLPFFAALGSVALIFGLILFGPSVMPTIAIRVYSQITEPSYASAPMFVLMGTILGGTGVAEMLFDGIYRMFGPVRGGLLVAVDLICTLLAACTGVAAGPVATMALIALPKMLQAKYDHGIACGIISASATLGVLIPPSGALIVYGLQSELSVGKLYAAAYLPGFMLSALFLIYVLILPFVKPYMAPAAPPEMYKGVSLGAQLKLVALGILPVIFLIVAVMVSLFAGICTATEASGVGALGALLISIAYRKFTLKGLSKALLSAYRSAAMIGGMVIGASFFSAVFMGAGGSAYIQRILKSYNVGAELFIWIMMLIAFILGFVMSQLSILFIMVPIFVPVLRAYKIDEIWFAMLFQLDIQIAYLTPPMAPGVYLLKPLCPTEITLKEMYIGIIPFIIIDIAGMVLVYLFPIIATIGPKLMMGSSPA
jgi:tripartite ATP-independent transporter DctM subunit